MFQEKQGAIRAMFYAFIAAQLGAMAEIVFAERLIDEKPNPRLIRPV